MFVLKCTEIIGNHLRTKYIELFYNYLIYFLIILISSVLIWEIVSLDALCIKRLRNYILIHCCIYRVPCNLCRRGVSLSSQFSPFKLSRLMRYFFSSIFFFLSFRGNCQLTTPTEVVRSCRQYLITDHYLPSARRALSLILQIKLTRR